MGDKVALPRFSQKWLSQNFVARDFDCPCGYCSDTIVSMDLIDRLQTMRNEIGSPVFISKSGGFRCHYQQEKLRQGGAETSVGISQHELGNAADISSPPLTGEQLAEYAEKAGFLAIGVGKNWVHVDTRAEPHRWEYKKT